MGPVSNCFRYLCACVILISVSYGYGIDIPKEPVPLADPVTDFLDRAFADLRRVIVSKGIEPILLPSDSDNFTATLFNTVMDGHVWVGDGQITGISTLHRTGNLTRHMAGLNEMIIEGQLGFTDLEGKYFSEFKLGPFGSEFGIVFKISYVSLGVKTGIFILASDIVFEECYIDDLSSLQIHFKGIGLFDSKLYSMLANAATQLLEPVITAKIEGVVCDILQHVITGAFETTTTAAALKDKIEFPHM